MARPTMILEQAGTIPATVAIKPLTVAEITQSLGRGDATLRLLLLAFASAEARKTHQENLLNSARRALGKSPTEKNRDLYAKRCQNLDAADALAINARTMLFAQGFDPRATGELLAAVGITDLGGSRPALTASRLLRVFAEGACVQYMARAGDRVKVESLEFLLTTEIDGAPVKMVGYGSLPIDIRMHFGL